jgi:hypothetical protein
MLDGIVAQHSTSADTVAVEVATCCRAARRIEWATSRNQVGGEVHEIWYMLYLGLVFVANALLLGLSCSAFVYFSYRRVRMKGYRPPAAAAIILATGAVGIVLTVLRKATPNASYILFFFDYFWVPLLLSAVAMGILLLILPQRKTRVFGQRRVRFPFVGVGRALIGSGLILIAVAAVLWAYGMESGSLVLAALVLTVVVSPTAFYLIRRGQRAKSVLPAEAVLKEGSRAPVLYLRAFVQESRFFVIGPNSEYGSYARSWHAAAATTEQNVGVTFEEFLTVAVANRIGPFVALGSPEDYLPPEGALRTYADDTGWKELFDRFAQQSACIIAEVGNSANLRWEFTRIRQEGLQEKLFVFTPCSAAGYRFQWAFWNLLWFLKGLHQVGWREFSKDLKELGFEIGCEDPGPGSVITFDPEGRGMVLTTQARRPGEFIEPIAAWMTAREETGRHIRASCCLCGKPLYLFSKQAETAGKQWCQACEMSSQPGARARSLSRIFYWAYLLLWPFALMAIFRMFRPQAGWWDRLQGGMVAGLLLLAIAIHVWVVKADWDGSPKDDRKAVNWYRYAADRGSANAMVNFGLMYRRGWGGLPRDDVEAARWYRKAADAGSAIGMNNLGFLYENGIGGFPKSEEEAIAWYKRAGNLGQPQALESLKRLRGKG